MNAGAATILLGGREPSIEAAPALAIGALLVGRPIAEAADLLPRVFNLCAAAQATAARLSLGLPAQGGIEAEIVRDHVCKLCLSLPGALGMAPLPIPRDPAALLGRAGLPDSLPGLAEWNSPTAPLALAVARSFGPRIAVCPALPQPDRPLEAGAFENSAAGRQAGRPLLRSVEASHGRGPLWRLLGLLADLEAALLGRLPEPQVEDGVASVAAARGVYALRLRHERGRITAVERRTPTDHILAPGGALLQSLRSLPASMSGLAAAVVALHDPCVPVTVRAMARQTADA